MESYKEKNCGNCLYRKYFGSDDTFLCDNEESDVYGFETDFEDSCIDYEEKEQL